MDKQTTLTEKRFFKWEKDDISVTLRNKGGSYGGGSEVLVVYAIQAFGVYKKTESASALKQRDYKDATDLIVDGDTNMNMTVRRLTPMECERLQGFPDGWTNIGEWTDTKGKKHKDTDSPRYKALGNSIALPFWEWMAKRMVAEYPQSKQVTIASLFDGIGGFPLVYERAGAKAIWASEIEDFCIAVTKKHFGDEDTGEKGDFSEAIKKFNGNNYDSTEIKQPFVFEPGVTSRDSKHIWEDGIAPTIRMNPGDNHPCVIEGGEGTNGK